MIFDLPIRLILAAPSQSGKSTFVLNLLKNREKLMRGKVDGIIWSCINRTFAPQQLHSLPNVKICEGLPELDSIPSNTIVVIDDLQQSNLKDICTLFCVNSHHFAISTIFIIQNLFIANPYMRTISLNASAFCIFRSLRDINQIQYLARQIFPNVKNSFLKVYQQETEQPYQCIIIDLSQRCSPILRIKSQVLNDNYFVSYATDREIDIVSEKAVEKSTLNEIPYFAINVNE